MYRLRRVRRKDARVFGVCGGLAKYIDYEMDPVIMRIIWVALSLFQPFFIILYLILALVLKQEDEPEKEEKTENNEEPLEGNLFE